MWTCSYGKASYNILGLVLSKKRMIHPALIGMHWSWNYRAALWGCNRFKRAFKANIACTDSSFFAIIPRIHIAILFKTSEVKSYGFWFKSLCSKFQVNDSSAVGLFVELNCIIPLLVSTEFPSDCRNPLGQHQPFWVLNKLGKQNIKEVPKILCFPNLEGGLSCWYQHFLFVSCGNTCGYWGKFQRMGGYWALGIELWEQKLKRRLNGVWCRRSLLSWRVRGRQIGITFLARRRSWSCFLWVTGQVRMLECGKRGMWWKLPNQEWCGRRSVSIQKLWDIGWSCWKPNEQKEGLVYVQVRKFLSRSV